MRTLRHVLVDDIGTLCAEGAIFITAQGSCNSASSDPSIFRSPFPSLCQLLSKSDISGIALNRLRFSRDTRSLLPGIGLRGVGLLR